MIGIHTRLSWVNCIIRWLCIHFDASVVRGIVILWIWRYIAIYSNHRGVFRVSQKRWSIDVWLKPDYSFMVASIRNTTYDLIIIFLSHRSERWEIGIIFLFLLQSASSFAGVDQQSGVSSWHEFWRGRWTCRSRYSQWFSVGWTIRHTEMGPWWNHELSIPHVFEHTSWSLVQRSHAVPDLPMGAAWL